MNLRLLPLLGVTASALLVLKLLGMAIGPEGASLPVNGAVAQEAAGNGEADATVPIDGGDPMAPPEEPVLPDSLEIGGSAAERAVLESLGKRRESLQEQEGQLDLREKLLQATEERIQKRVNELKKLEQEIESTLEKQQKQEESEIAGLVTMYETMKPKDAARIFNRLNLDVLLKVVRQMKPRKMADVLAKMTPEAAEKLTVAIAGAEMEDEMREPQAQASVRTPASSQNMLPKIPSN